MYANTYRLYYSQGAANFYTVSDYGDLIYIPFDKVISVITHLVITD
jgi:hypothetical protein